MNKKIIAISVLIVAILVVSAIAETIFYYNGKIANLNSQISNLKGQVANLNGQITNLTSANLVPALGITEIPYYSPFNKGWATKFSHVYISGYVINAGGSMAYNAGLQVLAYGANGELLMNLTVPLDNGAIFGSDAGSYAYLSSFYETNSLQLGNLYSQQNATISISIYHEGTFSNSTNYNIIPVWTNSP
jgi:hypothetical protein